MPTTPHRHRGTRLLACVTVVTAPMLVGTLVAAAAGSATAAEAGATSVDRTLNDRRINESSGLAASTRFPNVVITHNDSGDTARVFAVDQSGQTRATWTLDGASSWDWEDIASRPADHTVWVGDIGDNFLRHDSLQVYSFTEPATLNDAVVQPNTFELGYPGGVAHNAEALMVRPNTGRVLVATKEKGGGGLYRAPLNLSTSGVNVLERIASVPSIVTAGDISPISGDIALRTYGSAYVYDSPTAEPRVMRLPHSGESLAFNTTGDALLVGSEGIESDVWQVPLG